MGFIRELPIPVNDLPLGACGSAGRSGSNSSSVAPTGIASVSSGRASAALDFEAQGAVRTVP